MIYTIKQLADISGVTPRTLRFYDKINLLNPAYTDKNNYRYYEEEQLLILQQILFYRELDFSLKDIQTILSKNNFSKISSLNTHKMLLQEKLQKLNHMLKTIDKTVLHLRGEIAMQVEEFFDPIRLRDNQIQKEYAKYLVGHDILTQEEMDASFEKIKSWTKKDFDKFKSDGDKFYKKMAAAIDANIKADSSHVQNLVHKHYLLIKPLWQFNQTSYLKLANAYLQDKNFNEFCTLYHPKLCKFIVEAMQYYAKNSLT